MKAAQDKNPPGKKLSKKEEQFYIPRDDPYDPYKPNARTQVAITAQSPLKQPLDEKDQQILQRIASDYDNCISTDILEDANPKPHISEESQEQLDRLPTWVRTMIENKYEDIHKKYGHQTHNFLKLLGNHVDVDRTMLHKAFDERNDHDGVESSFIEQQFTLDEKDVEHADKDGPIKAGDLMRVAQALGQWRVAKTLEYEWSPAMVHRGSSAMRTAMLTQVAGSDIAIVDEDEKATQLRNKETEDETKEFVFKRKPWEKLVTETPAFQKEVKEKVDDEFNKDIDAIFKTRKERNQMKEKKKEIAKAKVHNKDLEDANIRCCKICCPNRRIKRSFWKKRGKELIQRGGFRDYSRIWWKDCPKEQINPPKVVPYHYRLDECFHAYCVDLVLSQFFRTFIITVILLNAVLLAFETTGESQDEEIRNTFFQLVDDIFLSIYTIEFLVKIYAHPYSYWNSGFNVFDFIILLVSLIKATVDWLNFAEVSFLRVLLIVRALRILRGLSLSVQMQVLITALMETVKTHVVSVIILLLLLMYIASIIAYYMFADYPLLKNSWGSIGIAMLRLFSFVTMDGWTDLLDEFEYADLLHQGRMFCLIGIVLGNFVYSNIFIAIIIMQISEATEDFRSKQQEERESIIARKKDAVYRRQKLDMRQLLSKQRLSTSTDFYYMGTQFQKLLNHRDLVDMDGICFCPLWIDCLYSSLQRYHHTSNLIMNIHRQLADSILEAQQLNKDGRYVITKIRRGRYNRWMKLKSKLSLIKDELYQAKHPKKEKKIVIKLPEEKD